MDKGALTKDNKEVKVAKRILRLNRGPYAFGGIYPDWKNWKVVFGWVAETDFENIALVTVVVWNLPPRWPPFKSSSCFTEPPSRLKLERLELGKGVDVVASPNQWPLACETSTLLIS